MMVARPGTIVRPGRGNASPGGPAPCPALHRSSSFPSPSRLRPYTSRRRRVFVERESGHTIGIDSPWWLIEADDDELDWNRFTFTYGVPTGHVTTLLLASFGDQLQTSRSPDIALGVGVRFRALEVPAMQYGHRASETLVQTGGGPWKEATTGPR